MSARSTRFAIVGVVLAIGLSQPAAATAGAPQSVAPGSPSPQAQNAAAVPVAAGSPEFLLEQGKRLFDGFQYDLAIPIFDRLIVVLTTDGQPRRPELLTAAYELRARSRFAMGDSAGTEEDFSSLLAVNPGFRLTQDISPRVVEILQSVRTRMIGQVHLSISPVADVTIDGQPVAVTVDPQVVELLAGDHQVTATRAGYRTTTQTVAVSPGGVETVRLELERVSATLTITSVPAQVDVTFDGQSRGLTPSGTNDVSAPLVITDLQPGTYRLLLRRPCYTSLERTVTIERPDDVHLDTLRLSPSVATVTVDVSDSAVSVLLDGVRQGTGRTVLANVCEGTHLIEARGPGGRFMDRREWKAGDAVTLTANLRPPFPIVAVAGVPTSSLDRVRASVEDAFDSTPHVLLYVPPDAEVQGAIRREEVPPDWLIARPDPDRTAAVRVSAELRRDIASKLATHLGVPGVAGIAATDDPDVYLVALIASGSAEPDVVSINLSDVESRAAASAYVGASLPSLTRAGLDISTIDVLGTPGAVVIRVGPGAAQTGLAVGDVIVAAAGAPVTSVAELLARVAAVPGGSGELVVDVQGPGGDGKRSVTTRVALSPDTLPVGASLPYNRFLVELRDRLARAPLAPMELVATRLNLAIVNMRLGNFDEALAALNTVSLPEGGGVSAGTVAYLAGLCHEALARPAEAKTAFTKALTAVGARLSQNGALIAPLAQRKLQ